MKPADRATFIDMLVASWETEKPGCLPLPLSLGAKVVGLHVCLVRGFLARNPHTFVEQDGWLVNEKLRRIWLETQEIKDKRKHAADVRWHAKSDAHASSEQMHMQCSAFAFADTTVNQEHVPHAVAPPRSAQNPPCEDGFLLFIAAYPQDHLGVKAEAMRTWADIVGINQHVGEVIAGLETWKRSDRWLAEGGRYIPNARRFLAARQWQTTPPKGEQRNGTGKAARNEITEHNLRTLGFKH